MPALILVIGVLIGLYALSRFVLKAKVKTIKAFSLTALSLLLGWGLLYLALTGRLIAALGITAILTPLLIRYVFSTGRKNTNTPSANTQPMSRCEALDILGLDEHASEKEIRATYKTLIAKVHPDRKGSKWLAAKLNEARDCLLK